MGESETRKIWRGPADPSLSKGPVLIDVFVYARGVAVFQRMLGVTLGKRQVKLTKLRGFPLFLGRTLPKTQQHFISPLPERCYNSCSPERFKLFKLFNMFLCRTSGCHEFTIANMLRPAVLSCIHTCCSQNTYTGIYTSADDKRALRWVVSVESKLERPAGQRLAL